MDDDLQVINRVIAGEIDSFRILVRRYEAPLFRLLRNLTPGAHDCEDIAQEAFLAAFRNLRSFDHRRSAFATWLFTIARNKCVNVLKKRKPAVLEDLPDQLDWQTPDVAVTQAELFRQLDSALASLPFEQRTAFVLAEIQGLAYDEIARIEDVAVGTVKSRISRAKEKLRSLLRQAREHT
jgi:RNA polymerase sigma-70 factor (ECF subfamily)